MSPTTRFVNAHRSDGPGAFIPVALVFLAGLVGGAVIDIILPISILSGPWIRFMGLVPLVAGVSLFGSARMAFRRHRTALLPLSLSTHPVEDGPYRYLGTALILDYLYILLMLPVVRVLFDRQQLPREERYLEKFHGDFIHYEAEVRRLL
jgi:protein-S-isoprenylcysteine O-methyltransferase Ste14